LLEVIANKETTYFLVSLIRDVFHDKPREPLDEYGFLPWRLDGDVYVNRATKYGQQWTFEVKN
jgi:hypothetical protein